MRVGLSGVWTSCMLIQLRQSYTASWALTALERDTDRPTNCYVATCWIPRWRKNGPCAAWRKQWVRLRLCNCRRRSWGVTFSSTYALVSLVVVIFLDQEVAINAKNTRSAVWVHEMRSGCVLEEKAFWKKYQFYNHCRRLTQQGPGFATAWNRKQEIKPSRFVFSFFLVFSLLGGNQAPSFSAFVSCR